MKKAILVIVLIALSTIRAIDLQTIPNNTWVQLTDIQRQFPSGYAGQFSQRFWCNFTWDPDSQRILFYEGYLGDHGQIYSIYANAIYSLKPAAETVRMLELSTDWENASNGSGWFFTTGIGQETPHPRHTNAGFKYISKYHNIYLGFGACENAQSMMKALWKYNTASGAWAKIASPLPDPSMGDGYYVHFANLPGSDTLWMFAPDGGQWLQIYGFNMQTEQWFGNIDYGPQAVHLTHVAEDTLRKKILVWTFTETASVFHNFDPRTGLMSEITNVPADFPQAANNHGIMSYLPNVDKFLIYCSTARQMWTFSPADSSWKKISAANIPGTRIDDYFVYDPVDNVAAIFDENGTYQVFRYADEPAAAELRHAERSVDLTAYPNPFTSGTSIQFDLSGAWTGSTALKIFDVKGKMAADLSAGGALSSRAGKLRWNAGDLPCGVYVLQLENSGRKFTRRLVRIK